MKRSYTPHNLAAAEASVHAHAVGGDESDFGRPANVPCKQYPVWRATLLHNFALFAAHYAPRLSQRWLSQRVRGDAIILMPVAQSPLGPCAMVS